MSQRTSIRVFVSSTLEDLREYRRAAQEVISDFGWDPKMSESFGAVPTLTVAFCQSCVADSDVVLLISAFRRGFVPKVSQGGDGSSSITALEIQEANRLGIPVLALLADKSWPGSLYEEQSKARKWVQKFRAGIDRPAAFFSHEKANGLPAFQQQVKKALLDHQERLQKFPRQAVASLLLRLECLLTQANVPFKELASAYTQCAPRGWENMHVTDTKPAAQSFVRSLAEATCQRDGSIPLFEFVKLLRDSQPPISAALEVWLDEATWHFADGEPERQKLLARRPSLRPSSASKVRYLLIQAARSQVAENIYTFKAWLFEGGRAFFLLEQDKQAQNDLPHFIRESLEEVADVATSGSLRIELLLPREVLCADSDQWSVPVDLLSEALPLGAQFPLVVRSWERTCLRRALANLRERCEKLSPLHVTCCKVAAQLPTSGREHAVWIVSQERGASELFLHLGDSQAVCGLFATPPSPRPAAAQDDALQALLAAGLPVALWSRDATAIPEALRSHLVSLVGELPLAELIDRVWKLRRQAVGAGEPGHPGKHLSLLWDDPSRLPPEYEPQYRFRAPGKSGGN